MTNNKSYAHIMVGLETLSTQANALILSIGACCFYLSGEIKQLPDSRVFYQILNYKQQDEEYLRHVNLETQKWLFHKVAEAKKVISEAKNQNLGLTVGVQEFTKWLEGFKSRGYEPLIYGNGEAFDNDMLKSLYDDLELPLPWGYKADICYRTLKAMYGYKVDWSKVKRQGTYHNALEDAKYQASVLKLMLEPEELYRLGVGAFS
jgi:3' exoribonuclease, RNase T-like